MLVLSKVSLPTQGVDILQPSYLHELETYRKLSRTTLDKARN